MADPRCADAKTKKIKENETKIKTLSYKIFNMSF